MSLFSGGKNLVKLPLTEVDKIPLYSEQIYSQWTEMCQHASIVFHIIASDSNYIAVVQVTALKWGGEIIANLLFQIDFRRVSL